MDSVSNEEGFDSQADAGQGLIYHNPDSAADIEVRLEGETVWLTQSTDGRVVSVLEIQSQ